jgi:sucrose-6-phosphate hydrolase SacC (GH32 family)
MVRFNPYPSNPVLSGTGKDTWDRLIRERGFILFDEGIYKLWYSGYNFDYSEKIYLGYATSADGVHWERHDDNPIFDQKWTEDMFVEKEDNMYYMFAEGEDEEGHLLISRDGISWEAQGPLEIFTVLGDTMPGPYGTPTIWIEQGTWYLFYERDDDAVWLAQSADKEKLKWINVQDEPVLKRGPNKYDRGAVAVDHIVKKDSIYYMYYHGTSSLEWLTTDSMAVWNSNVAVSDDLLHWTKYPGNPIVEGDHSSPVVLLDGNRTRLYTMHPDVCLYLSK